MEFKFQFSFWSLLVLLVIIGSLSTVSCDDQHSAAAVSTNNRDSEETEDRLEEESLFDEEELYDEHDNSRVQNFGSTAPTIDEDKVEQVTTSSNKWNPDTQEAPVPATEDNDHVEKVATIPSQHYETSKFLKFHHQR